MLTTLSDGGTFSDVKSEYSIVCNWLGRHLLFLIEDIIFIGLLYIFSLNVYVCLFLRIEFLRKDENIW